MTIQNVRLELIDDNPFQPRTHYSTNKVEEIAYSIKEIGLRQTPEARPVGGRFQLAYGHLRKRSIAKLFRGKPKDACTEAAEMIKQGTMPLDVKDISDHLMLLYGIEENLRRVDITPLDLARSAEIYCTKLGKSETDLAKKLNMTQGNVSNMRRVLRLSQKVLQYIEEGKINFTMARELLVFQGLSAGHSDEWSRSEHSNVKVPRDEEYLMIEAIRGVGGSYGPSATVDGIKKSIFTITERYFKALEHSPQSYGYGSERNPLFDTREAGCLKCAKMIRANETKSLVRHFCTDPKCWDKKQEAHKRKQAEKAKKKMEADIAERIVATEGLRKVEQAATGSVPDEVTKPEETSLIPMMNEEEIDGLADVEAEGIEDEEETDTAPPSWPRFDTIEALCVKCMNKGNCSGGKQRPASYTGSSDEQRKYVCGDRMAKEDQAKVAEKAKVDMPDSFKAMVKEQAGTRNEVLDLRELRCGGYGDMKAGYLLLSSSNYHGGTTLDIMMDPKECTERCTKGYHYGFDSSPRRSYEPEKGTEVYSICSNPKCAAQKKAAFTRAKNAAGMEKKKAETAANKSAVEQTTKLDKPRMRLIIKYCLDNSRHYYDDRDRTLTKFIMTRLGVETVKRKDADMADREKTEANMFKAIEDAPEETLAKVIVEMMLEFMRYSGDMGDYKVQTTEPLNWMGIGVQVPK